MRKAQAFFLTVLMSCTIHSGTAAQTAIPDTIRLSPELRVCRIEPDVWFVTHFFPWPCNSLVYRMTPADVFLVDTPYENEATRVLIEWIHSLGPEIRLKVINTHFHRDNLGGNTCALEQGIPVWGSDSTAILLRKKIPSPSLEAVPAFYREPGNERYLRRIRASPLMPPDHRFPLKKGLAFQTDRDTLEIWYPGAGHTTDNVVVYIHSRRILFGGCLVKDKHAREPGNIEDADMSAWPASLQRLLKRFPDVRIVIPGHGDWGGPDLIQHTLSLLEKDEPRPNGN